MFRRRIDRLGSDLNATLSNELERLRADIEAGLERTVDALRVDRQALEQQRRSDEVERDARLSTSMERLAESMEMLAEVWSSERGARAREIELLEFLVREQVLRPERANGATALPSPIIGGAVGAADTAVIDLRVGDATHVAADVALMVGTTVEVRSHFDDHWSHGFEIAEVVKDGACVRYRLLRHSDKAMIPVLFDVDEVRRLILPDVDRLIHVSEIPRQPRP